MARRRDLAVERSGAPSGPVRTCVGCRRRAAKTELVRVTAGTGAAGSTVLRPDAGGAADGRGAHLHPTAACLDLALRRKAFGRALRLTGTALDSRALAQHVEQHGPKP